MLEASNFRRMPYEDDYTGTSLRITSDQLQLEKQCRLHPMDANLVLPLADIRNYCKKNLAIQFLSWVEFGVDLTICCNYSIENISDLRVKNSKSPRAFLKAQNGLSKNV